MSAIFGCRDRPKLTRWALLWLLLAPTLFLHSTRARCEEPTALSKEQTQERQRTIDELDKEYSKLQADGKLDEAIATLEKSMNIQLEVYGTDRDDGVNSMEWLARLAALKGDFRRAREWSGKALAIEQQGRDAAHWRVVNAKKALAFVERMTNISETDRARLREALQWYWQANNLAQDGKHALAQPLAQKALQVRREILDPEEIESFNALALFGWTIRDQFKYDEAEAPLRETLQLREKVLGDTHPDIGNACGYLAWLYVNKENFPQAETLFRRAADTFRKTDGELGLRYIQAVRNLAQFYARVRDYRRSEALHLESLELRRRTLQDRGLEYGVELQELGEVYHYLRQFDKAETYLRQAIDVVKQSVGTKHIAYVRAIGELSGLFRTKKLYDESLALELEMLAIQRELVGDDHFNVAFQHYRISHIYEVKKDYSKAVETMQLALATYIKSLGEKDSVVPLVRKKLADLLNLYCDQQQFLGNFTAAREATNEMLQLQILLNGENHWSVTDARHAIAFVDQLEKMPENDRRELAKAKELWRQVREIGRGKPAETLPPAEQSLEIRQRLLGEKHWVTIDSIFQVGYTYKEMGDLKRAEPMYVRLPELCRTILGETHPFYFSALHNLANLRETQGDTTEAVKTYRQALEVAKRSFGEVDSRYANTLNSLAANAEAMDNYAEAESLYRRALEIRRTTVGSHHEEYAHVLLNLGFFYLSNLRDYGKAEALISEAVEVYRSRLGEEHPDYGRSLDYLGTVNVRLKKFDRAEALYKQALGIRQKALGENHADCSITLQNLGVLYSETHKYAEAESYFKQAIDVDTKSTRAPLSIALTKSNLAQTYADSDRYAEAIELYKQVLETRRKLLGTNNLNYAETLSELGEMLALQGDPAAGASMTLEALHVARRFMEETAETQSEYQQLQLRQILWTMLDHYLEVSPRANIPAEQLYAEVLPWKGVVGARQQQLRRLEKQLVESGNTKALELKSQLDKAIRELARLSRATGSDADRRFRLQEVSDKIESLQQQLSAASAEYRRQIKEQQRTADDIRAALPANAVLVDFLSVSRRVPQAQRHNNEVWQSQLMAFVVAPRQAVARVEFGPAKEVEDTVKRWRESFGRKAGKDDPSAKLRSLVWLPLVPLMADRALVLISPNSATAPIPWPALPGAKPGTFLIDERSFAIAPIPRLLVDLSQKDGQNASSPVASSLLVVGDVDFDAAIGGAAGSKDPGAKSEHEPSSDGAPDAFALAKTTNVAVRGSQGLHWSALPGTRDEVTAIRSTFAKQFSAGKSLELAGKRATKSAVQDAASKFQYLHFSTHGFFSPPAVRSATAEASTDDATDSDARARASVREFHPGLLSGLVLAGANQPADVAEGDGILTALEVAELDLSGVQLATLSACETGLGTTAGGEGLLGLQRAFQSAGARTVIAGMWKVPDKATQLLMSRFYDNLWQKHMSRLEALREAQLWILREGTKQKDLLRGLDPIADAEGPIADESGRLSPYYWAAFMLSGDWR
jgi:CHAT domain-containing protein/Tfp pilus assembly protein PilF